MSDTRRFDPFGDPADPANDPQPPPPRHPLDAMPPLYCLRCGGLMLPTQAISTGSYGGVVALMLRDAKSEFFKGVPLIYCASMTCRSCGYTELYADVAGLEERLQEREVEEYKAEQRERRRQRSWE